MVKLLIKFTILTENCAKKRGLLSEHGLSMLIEVDGYKVLFDTGQTDVFLKNAKVCGVDIATVDTLVLSHGHYDHTGGVPEFCRLNEKAKVYIHLDAFNERYNSVDGKPVRENIGIPWKATDGFAESRLVFSKQPVQIKENILISGEILRLNGFQDTTPNFVFKTENSFERDYVIDEQFIAVEGSMGIYVFVGCSHPGIINCIEYAERLFPNKKITAVIGGMHLDKTSSTKLSEIIMTFKDKEIDKIIPLHCTGAMATCEIKRQMGDRCILCSCGDEIVLEG